MYLDIGTMIGIMIALTASMVVMGYGIYIIKIQNDTIARMHAASSARRKRDATAQ
jgi:hypothetical protein